MASIRQTITTQDHGNVEIASVHLNSHSDCCIFSENARVLNLDISRTINLTPFKSGLGSVDGIYVSTIAVAYDDVKTFNAYILIFHEALQVPGMCHHILCPNQIRDNDIQVNDIPLIYTPVEDRNEHTHAIVVNATHLIIPLDLDGVHSSFNCREPSDLELSNPSRFPHLIMTADRIWEPNDSSFRDNESSVRSSLTFARYPTFENRQVSEVNMHLSAISTALNDDLLPNHLTISTIVSSEHLSTTPKEIRKGATTPLELAKRWFTGLHSAKRTLECTTQRGVRDFTFSEGTRRLRHSTYQLMYKHLRSLVYTDTMFATVKSVQGNNCAQVYTTWFSGLLPIQYLPSPMLISRSIGFIGNMVYFIPSYQIMQEN
jgi:hypothetical protein